MAAAVPTLTIAAKYGLPQFKETRDFDQWENEMEIWKLVTELPVAKHGPVTYLSLSDKIKSQCNISKEVLAKDDGLTNLVAKLRELYASSKEQAMFGAYEKFENFCRPDNMKMSDYINEFERMYATLKNYKIELPTVVLCYRLLKSANLPKDRRDLARATISELTYDAMKKQIKAIYDHCSSTAETSDESNFEIIL